MDRSFYGLKTSTLENPRLRLDYLTEAGPRLVRLLLDGSSDNFFAEVDTAEPVTPYGVYHIRGGHRLWHAPESMPRTYIPDDEGLVVEEVEQGIRLIQPDEPGTGIGKVMEVALDPVQPCLTLEHTLTNKGLWPVELAPWALTQLALGGTVFFPDQIGPLDPHGLLANRSLILWPYTQWEDPRLQFADDLLLLHTAPILPPAKFGYFNRTGWIGYYRGGTLFIKRFAVQPDQPHVDNGCNAETYCNNRFVELETIGPLARLDPGQSITHTERWEFTTQLDYPQTLDGIRALVRDLKLR